MTGVPCMTSIADAMAELMVVPLTSSVWLVSVFYPSRAVVVTLGAGGTCGVGASRLIVMAMLVVGAGLGHAVPPSGGLIDTLPGYCVLRKA